MRGIIGCALCDGVAAMHCESDQASLCWNCDAKVHGANFLVARHTRVLLCRHCQENTPWKASGARLSPTVSVCVRCAAGGMASSAVGEGEDHCEGAGGERAAAEEEDRGDDVSDTEEDGEDDEEEGENQVVPWSSLTSPPPATSSSGEESSSTERSGSCLSKRPRENDDFASQDFISSSSSRWHHLVASSPPPPASFPSRSASPAFPSSYSSKKGRRSLLETTPPHSSAEIAGNHMPSPGDRSRFSPPSDLMADHSGG
ncbi:hypothetical protein KSP40_PGU010694 [Platanthera guangdongensis]|uniref:B box-type domain-containing protein n=1 Tax=Platanthera guangdongensis TaxID=2320717 RepID=A0ABR2LX89_9ASPA